MKIGELAKRAHVSARLLRYYEEHGLLTPGRSANGYRDYAESLVDRVEQIRGLLDAGLPTRIIKQILPCLTEPRVIVFADATPEMMATLEREREHLDQRIRCLTRNRDAIASYLEDLRRLIAADSQVTPGAESTLQAEEERGAVPSARRAPR